MPLKFTALNKVKYMIWIAVIDIYSDQVGGGYVAIYTISFV